MTESCRVEGCKHPVTSSFPDGTKTCACHDKWWPRNGLPVVCQDEPASEEEICHVCKRVKKPYNVFMCNEAIHFILYQQAREDGPICQRCDQYFAMTGEFKDASQKEFDQAKQAAKFTRYVTELFEQDLKAVGEKVSWPGSVNIAKHLRERLAEEGDSK